MVPSAIELRRRVASRKLHEGLEEGRITDNILITMKEKSRDERQTHLKETFVISDVSIKSNVSLTRAEHQFQTQHQLKLLNRDVVRISRLSRAKIDTLSDLERRINKMRDLLREPKDPLVETMLDEEINANINSQVDSKFGICSLCQRRILLEVLSNHVVICERRKLERDGPAKITLESILKQANQKSNLLASTTTTTTTSAAAATTTTNNGAAASSSSKPLFNTSAIATAKATADTSTVGNAVIEVEEYIRQEVYDVESSFIVKLNTLPPQPPRHCSVVSIGQLP
jgi:hypothetical protein